MTEHPYRPPVAAQDVHCFACGYDLRGSNAARCPECGTPKSIPIGIDDSQQFHQARARLEHEGLLVRHVDPGGPLGVLGIAEGLPSRTGWLWVSALELDRVERCLDELGVVSSIGARPIVDRAEPVCPKCGSALDPDGAETCPVCAAAFQWVEIDEPDVDNTGLICPACDYDLTGSDSERCPECGGAIPRNLDAMVSAATRAAKDSADETATAAPGTLVRPRPIPRSVILECSIITIFAAIGFALLWNANLPVVGAVVVGLTMLAVVVRLLRQ